MKTNYSSQVGMKSPAPLNVVMSSQRDDIHYQMYIRALSRWMDSTGINESTHKLVEIPGSDFDSPSYVIATNLDKPRKTKTYYLGSYWDNNYFSPETSSPMSYMMLDEDNTINTLEIVSKDYVNGTAKVYSRYTQKSLDVKLDELSYDFPVSEQLDYKTTFTYQANHLI